MSFQSDVDKFNRKVTKLVGEEFQSICINLMNDAIRLTPVDTGRLRANWQGTINTPASASIIASGSGGFVAADAAGSVGNLQADDDFYLTNNLSYAVPVEIGTEHFSGRRMLGRAIARASKLL